MHANRQIVPLFEAKVEKKVEKGTKKTWLILFFFILPFIPIKVHSFFFPFVQLTRRSLSFSFNKLVTLYTLFALRHCFSLDF